MKRLAKNPFKFGDPVEGDYYFPRPELSKIVMQLLDSRVHTVLIGPRRFGKTSFVLDSLRQLEAQGKTCIFIDVFNVTSHRDFLLQILRALRGNTTWSQRLKLWVESIPRLRPKFNWQTNHSTGETTFSVSPEVAERDLKDLIQDSIIALGEIGEQVIVAIDEFQTIAELGDQGWLEATLRTQMQQLKNTAFLFTGSRRSVINDMLNNSSRPFYRACQPLEFPVLDRAFSDWIVSRFGSVGVVCD
ncbi:MAG: ATP-binding protein, partial [Bdellovibrionales bacterium]|nr:ATP-binding protein [Bdellovibrionales bacterium]